MVSWIAPGVLHITERTTVSGYFDNSPTCTRGYGGVATSTVPCARAARAGRSPSALIRRDRPNRPSEAATRSDRPEWVGGGRRLTGTRRSEGRRVGDGGLGCGCPLPWCWRAVQFGGAPCAPLGSSGLCLLLCWRTRGGPPKIRGGPITKLQPPLPSHGLHCLLSSSRGQLASKCSIDPLCSPMSSLGSGQRRELLGPGLWRRVTLHYHLRLGRGAHAVFHVGSLCSWGVLAAAGQTGPHMREEGGRGGGGWHKASVFGCLPLAAPIGLSPLLILTLCGSERVLVVSTEPPDDLSCLTTPGVGCSRDGLLPVPLTRGIQMHPPSPCGGLLSPALTCAR